MMTERFRRSIIKRIKDKKARFRKLVIKILGRNLVNGRYWGWGLGLNDRWRKKNDKKRMAD
jgi:hypothetical protein